MSDSRGVEEGGGRVMRWGWSAAKSSPFCVERRVLPIYFIGNWTILILIYIKQIVEYSQIGFENPLGGTLRLCTYRTAKRSQNHLRHRILYEVDNCHVSKFWNSCAKYCTTLYIQLLLVELNLKIYKHEKRLFEASRSIHTERPLLDPFTSTDGHKA